MKRDGFLDRAAAVFFAAVAALDVSRGQYGFASFEFFLAFAFLSREWSR